MKRDESLIVDFNAEVTAGVYHLRLHRSSTIDDPLPAPGQFAMVQVREGASPLLRRPLSYLFADREHVEFLYRVAGVGTRILSKVIPSQTLNVLGPLGNGFNLSKAASSAVLVAGGMGLPPIYFLALGLKKAGIGNLQIIHGAKTTSEIVLEARIKSEKLPVHHATDDGSAGFKGKASELLVELLGKGKKPDVIYACGPHPMLKAVSDIALSAGIPCEVSIEANMACGVGACLGCAVKTIEGIYLQVCEDGPVFDAAALFTGK